MAYKQSPINFGKGTGSSPLNKNIDPPKPAVNKPRGLKKGESDAAYQAYLKKWREDAKKKNTPKPSPSTHSGSSSILGRPFGG